jgi:hypothetical protein
VISVNIAIKQFWLSSVWTPPVLKWKPLRDPATGWKEFKPPEWQVFVP